MPMSNVQLLITGGPGSGATTTAEALARRLGVACFDSDDFFHKPSDPPFVEQYSKDERNQRIIDVVTAPLKLAPNRETECQAEKVEGIWHSVTRMPGIEGIISPSA